MEDIFLLMAGVGGIVISVLHGTIGHRRILTRVDGLSAPLQQVNYAVFQLSTLYWFVGGVGLVLAPTSFISPQRELIAFVCAFIYVAGALGNFWATRGRHFGWPLLAIASTLAVLGANGG